MFDAIINALSSVLAWFGKVFVAVFQAMWDITIDLAIAAFDLFLSAVASLIAAAPAPQFLTQYSLQSLIGQMGSDILYFVSVFNIPQGLAMLGGAVAFRLFVRKLFTLGQW
ncbi:DUF2523 domain-containing protein [Ralstonia insidiosa]|uniref:DUF2523 domain-containing protein n=1 Tax=Ralstonia insidiosa TaxID=190721 RepID=A0A191ZW98_9RALS|nr:DUF2523 family protein [Ralstonia insidiosa]ANJ72435.1 DUF2523 domain-containing protein [Ralstonia insidiosa]KAB0472978.1 DUF2523 domain-containing protein [Ralstonia insidiosa]MBY4907387.1 DUF2523 domain-containing protein [Ralstonia insidiosa]